MQLDREIDALEALHTINLLQGNERNMEANSG